MIDVYIDDLLIKSKMRENHIGIFTQVFDRLIQYQFRLNLQKYVLKV